MEKALIKSPVGTLEITASDTGIRSLLFLETEIPEEIVPDAFENVVKQLREYFSGNRQQFDFPLDMQGSDFQLKVWKQLLRIPFGQTITYLELARRTGGKTLTRAVANANGRNRLNIVVPCHRVVGANGKLIGYGGGLWRKKFLLHHEQPHLFAGLDIGL